MSETPDSPAKDLPPQELEPDKDARTMAMLCHLLGIFTSWLGPLIIWLIKKDDSPFVDSQGKEALNFQITLFIGYMISSVLVCVFYLGLLTGGIIWVLAIVFGIMGAVATNRGEHYRYPINIRIIK